MHIQKWQWRDKNIYLSTVIKRTCNLLDYLPFFPATLCLYSTTEYSITAFLFDSTVFADYYFTQNMWVYKMSEFSYFKLQKVYKTDKMSFN